MSLQQRTIALAEGRQLEELVQLLAKEEAELVRCPMLNILDSEDDDAVLGWLDRLPGFDYLVLMTGEGLRRILTCADRHGKRDAAMQALAGRATITRGPKPVKALKEVGLSPTFIAPVPTTDGVIQTLRQLEIAGKTVGVQFYPNANPGLAEYLQQADAKIDAVVPYRYAPASDAEQVVSLIGKLADGAIDVIVFTSAPQVERLFQVAADKDLEANLRQGLARTQVAAVGPVVKEKLDAYTVRVDICPAQGFQMKNLVQHIKRAMTG